MSGKHRVMPDVTKINAYESGELDPHEELELFAQLISSGLAWELQGTYGRRAYDLIDADLITTKGEIL